MTDTPAGQTIRERDKGGAMKRMAAGLARKINSGILGQRAELPSSALADQRDASERTVRKAKKLLAGHGPLRKEGRDHHAA